MNPGWHPSCDVPLQTFERQQCNYEQSFDQAPLETNVRRGSSTPPEATSDTALSVSDCGSRLGELVRIGLVGEQVEGHPHGVGEREGEQRQQ